MPSIACNDRTGYPGRLMVETTLSVVAAVQDDEQVPLSRWDGWMAEANAVRFFGKFFGMGQGCTVGTPNPHCHKLVKLGCRWQLVCCCGSPSLSLRPACVERVERWQEVFV